jgi:uncharacterized protein YecT (DUF1311 family)
MQDQMRMKYSNLPPIDEELTICIYNNEATNSQLQCLFDAYSRWDAELNRIYNELLPLLDAQAATVLVDAQLQWIKCRDSEFKLLDVIFSSQGSIGRLIEANTRQEIVRKRVVELNQYLGFLSDLSVKVEAI